MIAATNAGEAAWRLRASDASAIVDIMLRRSPLRVGEPGPTHADLMTMLECAAAAPDHGGLQPWHFDVYIGSRRHTLARVFLAALTGRRQTASAEERRVAYDKACMRQRSLSSPRAIASIPTYRVKVYPIKTEGHGVFIRQPDDGD